MTGFQRTGARLAAAAGLVVLLAACDPEQAGDQPTEFGASFRMDQAVQAGGG